MTWNETFLARRLGVRLPIFQAPMAGGPSTPRLAAAVSNAGAIGSVAGALLGPDKLRAAIRETRALTDQPFAVNLFAPLSAPVFDDRVAAWAELSRMPAPPPRQGPRFEDQIAVVAEERVAVFSFTFGIPPGLADLDAFVVGTATTVEEAVALERAGAQAVVAQGYEAGGHRGTFLGPVERSLIGTLALVPQVADAVGVPVVASGGIMDGRGVAAALVLGAQGVQLGTAFLRSDEAGTSDEHRRALAEDTTVTAVLTGRHARAVRTPVVEELEQAGIAPPDYPLPRFFLRDPPMLAGQGGALARSLAAGALVAALADETTDALRKVTG